MHGTAKSAASITPDGDVVGRSSKMRIDQQIRHQHQQPTKKQLLPQFKFPNLSLNSNRDRNKAGSGSSAHHTTASSTARSSGTAAPRYGVVPKIHNHHHHHHHAPHHHRIHQHAQQFGLSDSPDVKSAAALAAACFGARDTASNSAAADADKSSHPSSNKSNPSSKSSKILPLPSHHIKRTASELQFNEDTVRAEYQDKVMFYRCYAAVESVRQRRRASEMAEFVVTRHHHAVTPPTLAPTMRRASVPGEGRSSSKNKANEEAEDWAVGDLLATEEDVEGGVEGAVVGGGNGTTGWPLACPVTQRGILRQATIGSAGGKTNTSTHHDDHHEDCDGMEMETSTDEVFLIEDL